MFQVIKGGKQTCQPRYHQDNNLPSPNTPSYTYALFIVTLMAIPLRNLDAHQIQNAANRLYHTANRQDNPLDKEMENRAAGRTTKQPRRDVVQRVQPTFGGTGPLAGLPIDH